jgi:predicted GIY-YIG superfamily endonuclease
MTAQPAYQEPGAPDWQVQAAATMQHLALLKRKADRLLDLRAQAEEQYLHGIAGASAAGLVTEDDLIAICHEYVTSAAPGYRARWDAALPGPCSRVESMWRNRPNGPHGSWFGTEPWDGGPSPRPGVCVVYVLFDAANVPCYAGSTKDLRNRFMGHRHDGVPFVRWVAYPAGGDREAAYQLEERLLAEHRPYLNKKVGR